VAGARHSRKRKGLAPRGYIPKREPFAGSLSKGKDSLALLLHDGPLRQQLPAPESRPAGYRISERIGTFWVLGFRLPARNVNADATTLPSVCATPWTWTLLVLWSTAHEPFEPFVVLVVTTVKVCGASDAQMAVHVVFGHLFVRLVAWSPNSIGTPLETGVVCLSVVTVTSWACVSSPAALVVAASTSLPV
jgi:hypothetical protein